jgi:ureidoacrylate peracid hydrolase
MKIDLSVGDCAIVVVDVQRLFAAPDGPFENVRSAPLVEAINELLDAGRAGSIPVIHSRYVLRADGADAGLLAGTPGLDLSQLAPDAHWAQLDDRVRVAETDLHCVHHRPSAFYASDLAAILRGLGADRVILSGLSLNNAVAATARDAFARDIPALIPRETVDAAPFESAADIEAGFRALDQWTAEVDTLSSVIGRLPDPR